MRIERRRLFAGTLPVFLLLMGGSVALAPSGVAHADDASQTAVKLTPEQRSAATALEGAFMQIADAVGPATVRIVASSPPPAPVRSGTNGSAANGSGGDGSGDNSGNGDAPDSGFPFSQFFGGPGGGGSRRFQMPQDNLPRLSRGSGVIIRPDGWIVTNDHVVEDGVGGSIKVILSDNTEYVGKVFRDPIADLAVIKIDADHPLPYVRMADAARVHVGQWAIAIGSPFAQENTMTTGIVSALHRSQQINDDRIARYYSDLVQTDAAINLGNSGGPLLNIDGELIGVNVAILSPTGTSSGIGFAIPINTVKSVTDQLIAKGKVTRATLGVVPGDIPPILRRKIGTTLGAYIDQVAPDTPADKAGIQPGDVITKFGAAEVGDEIALRNAISFASPGAAVPITLLRDGHSVSVTATLTERDQPPASHVRDTVPARKAATELGIVARPVTDEIAQTLGVPPGTKGVAVESVQPISPASDAGLSRGMIITSVNGKPVAALDTLNAAMSAAKSGDVLTLSVLIPIENSKPNRGVVNLLVP